MYEVYERLRNLKGMTDSDVARAASIQKTIICNWKKGKSVPKAAALWKISRIVECPVEWLIDKE